MPGHSVIALDGLTKLYGDDVAVDDLTFQVEPGVVTGFLGPNGAGKSTTMRMIMGLDAPSAGTVTVNGKPYAEHKAPLREVGALLEARAVHGGRTARDHLRVMAAASGIPVARVDEVLDLVGLTSVGRRRVGSFSLGMGQRLGVATALLGNPRTLILDEPVNGLDLDGIRWIRSLLRELAADGRTVFLSSHLMSEMALTADRVILLARGRLLRDQTMADFIADASAPSVRIRSPRLGELVEALPVERASVTTLDDGAISVDGWTSEQVGLIAAERGIPLIELTPVTASLEDAYLALTEDQGQHRTNRPTASVQLEPTR